MKFFNPKNQFSIKLYSGHSVYFDGINYKTLTLRAWWKRQPQRRPSTTELYWGFLLVDVDHWGFLLVDNDQTEVFYWSMTTRLRFSTGRHQPDWAFHGRRRPRKRLWHRRRLTTVNAYKKLTAGCFHLLEPNIKKPNVIIRNAC